jgi:hypothetical protein
MSENKYRKSVFSRSTGSQNGKTDYEKVKLAKLDGELKQAVSRGHISADEASTVKSGDSPSIVQKALYDVLPGLANSAGLVSDKAMKISRARTGSTWDTVFDTLGFVGYGVAATSEAMTTQAMQGQSGGALKKAFMSTPAGYGLIASLIPASEFSDAADAIVTPITSSISGALGSISSGLNNVNDTIDEYNVVGIGPNLPYGPIEATADAAEIAAGLVKLSGDFMVHGDLWSPGDGIRPGQAVDSFVESLRNRRGYIEFNEKHGMDTGSRIMNFGIGLAEDIFLDPTTYLGLGIVKGTKTAATGVASVAPEASKIAAFGGDSLTLSNLGSKMFKLKLRDMWPSLAEEFGKGVKSGDVDHATMALFNDRVITEVVKDFPQLWGKAVAEIGGRATRPMDFLNGVAIDKVIAKIATPGVSDTVKDAARVAMASEKAAISLAPTVDDLFIETSSTLWKERGIWKSGAPGEAVQRASVAIPVLGGHFQKLWNTFDRGWNVPPDLMNVVRETEMSIGQEIAGSVSVYQSNLLKFSDEQLNDITKVMTARAAYEAGAGPSPGSMARLSDDMEEAISFIKAEYENILETERRAGFDTQRVTNYVTRAYQTSPQAMEIVENVLRRNGVEAVGTANRFTEQRLIASFAEGRDCLKEGGLIENAFDLLHWRKRASIEMINREAVSSLAIKSYGVPAAMIMERMNGVPNGLLAGMARRFGNGVHEVVNVDQVFESKVSNLSRVGMSQNGDNNSIIRFFTKPVEYRTSIEGLKEADALGIPKGEAGRLWDTGSRTIDVPGMVNGSGGEAIRAQSITRGSLPNIIEIQLVRAERPLVAAGRRGTVSRGKLKLKTEDVLDMMDDPSHMLWKEITRSSVSGETIDPHGIITLLKNLDKFTMKGFDAKLSALYPDLERRIDDVLENLMETANPRGGTKLTPNYKLIPTDVPGEPGRSVKTTTKFPYMERFKVKLGEFIAEQALPWEIRKVDPVLPKWFEDHAIRSRAAIGNGTDRLPVSDVQRSEIEGLFARLSFDSSMSKKYSMLLTGHEFPVSERQADILIDSLLVSTNRFLENVSVGGSGPGIMKYLSKRFEGGGLKKVRLSFTQRVAGNPVGEVLDQGTGIPTAQGQDVGDLADGLNVFDSSTARGTSVETRASVRSRINTINRNNKEIVKKTVIEPAMADKRAKKLMTLEEEMQEQLAEDLSKRDDITAEIERLNKIAEPYRKRMSTIDAMRKLRIATDEKNKDLADLAIKEEKRVSLQFYDELKRDLVAQLVDIHRGKTSELRSDKNKMLNAVLTELGIDIKNVKNVKPQDLQKTLRKLYSVRWLDDFIKRSPSLMEEAGVNLTGFNPVKKIKDEVVKDLETAFDSWMEIRGKWTAEEAEALARIGGIREMKPKVVKIGENTYEKPGKGSRELYRKKASWSSMAGTQKQILQDIEVMRSAQSAAKRGLKALKESGVQFDDAGNVINDGSNLSEIAEKLLSNESVLGSGVKKLEKILKYKTDYTKNGVRVVKQDYSRVRKTAMEVQEKGLSNVKELINSGAIGVFEGSEGIAFARKLASAFEEAHSRYIRSKINVGIINKKYMQSPAIGDLFEYIRRLEAAADSRSVIGPRGVPAGKYSRLKSVQDKIRDLVDKKNNPATPSLQEVPQPQYKRISDAGGIESDRIVDQKSAADSLREARLTGDKALIAKAREKFFSSKSVIDDYEKAVKDGDEVLTSEVRSKLSAITGSDKYDGGLRPRTGEVSTDVWLPEGVAEIVKDLNARDGGMFSPFVSEWIARYDRLQKYYKQSLVTPFGQSWARNAIGAAATTVMRHGLAVFHPERANVFLKTMSYGLAKHSDMKGLYSATDIDSLGSVVLKSESGHEATVASLIDSMHRRGILTGLHDAELLQAPRVFGDTANRAGAAIQGGFVGGMGAYMGAAAVGADQYTASWSSAAAALMGAFVGGRRVGRGSIPSIGDVVKTAEMAAKTGDRAAINGLPVVGADAVTGMLQSGWKPVIRAGEAATEMPFRIMMYINEWMSHGSFHEAQRQVVRHMNDYHGMSVYERGIMRRVMPFYTWTRTAIRQGMASILERPTNSLNIYRIARDWGMAHDADPEDVPDFLSKSLVVMSRTGKRGETGVVYGFGIPLEDSAQITDAAISAARLATFTSKSSRKDFGEVKKAVVQRAPFGLASIVEGAFNEDTFSGKTIWEIGDVSSFQDGKSWRTAPSWIKAIVGYEPATRNTVEKVDPTIAWLLGEIPVSRFVSTMKSVYEMDGKNKTKANYNKLASQLLGVSVLVQKDGKVYKDKAKIDRMAEILGRAGALREHSIYSDVNPNDLDSRQGRNGTFRRRLMGKKK